MNIIFLFLYGNHLLDSAPLPLWFLITNLPFQTHFLLTTYILNYATYIFEKQTKQKNPPFSKGTAVAGNLYHETQNLTLSLDIEEGGG